MTTLPTHMKSYWMQSDGHTAQIELKESPVPSPGAGQIVLRVRAASLNRGEFILAHGLHKPGSAKAIGMEAAGQVVAVGEGAQAHFKVGDTVMGRCAGAFAEYALMDVREAMHMPANLSMAEAASIPLTFLVTHDMLVLQGQLQAGQWLLVTGVSSGVGVSALLMAKALGARVIGTSGSAEKLERLKALGLDVALHTREPNFQDAVMKATEAKGVNLVVNTVGGSVFAECISCMAFEGRLATVGYVDNQLSAPMDIQALHSKRLTLFGVSNKLRNAAQKAQFIPEFKAQILPMLASGTIKPLVDQTFAFEDLTSAKAAMDGNQAVGKIVLLGSKD